MRVRVQPSPAQSKAPRLLSLGPWHWLPHPHGADIVPSLLTPPSKRWGTRMSWFISKGKINS